jgi:hypothetical protein
MSSLVSAGVTNSREVFEIELQVHAEGLECWKPLNALGVVGAD